MAVNKFCWVVLAILPYYVMCSPVIKIRADDVPADELSNFDEGDIVADNQKYVGSIPGLPKISLWDNARVWPGGKVPYKIFSKEENMLSHDLTAQAIRILNQYNCVNFYDISLATDYDGDYINFVLGENLSSQLGNQRNGEQEITIIKDTNGVSVYSIVHELMHSLGFGHEHNRPDRDEYVEVLWDNLANGRNESYFKKYNYIGNFSTDNLLEYDFMSLMHATSLIPSLAKPDDIWNPVIKRKDSDDELSMHTNLTPLDIERLKKMYSCDICTGKNDGSLFRYPGDCTKYYQCDNSKPLKRDCPETLHINTDVETPFCDWPSKANCTEFFSLWDWRN